MLAQVTVVWLLPVLGFSFSVASLKSSCPVVSSGFLFPAQVPCCWVELSLPFQYWTGLLGMLGKCSWRAPKPSESTLGAVLPGTEHQALKPHPSLVVSRHHPLALEGPSVHFGICRLHGLVPGS